VLAGQERISLRTLPILASRVEVARLVDLRDDRVDVLLRDAALLRTVRRPNAVLLNACDEGRPPRISERFDVALRFGCVTVVVWRDFEEPSRVGEAAALRLPNGRGDASAATSARGLKFANPLAVTICSSGRGLRRASPGLNNPADEKCHSGQHDHEHQRSPQSDECVGQMASVHWCELTTMRAPAGCNPLVSV